MDNFMYGTDDEDFFSKMMFLFVASAITVWEFITEGLQDLWSYFRKG